MNTPKLLPWYASKAGVPIERARQLWRNAVRAATVETGWVGNSEFWGAAMDHFQRALKLDRASLCAPRLAPFVGSQKRIWASTLDMAGAVATAATRRWQDNLTRGRKAA